MFEVFRLCVYPYIASFPLFGDGTGIEPDFNHNQDRLNLVGREESNLPRIFGAMDTAGLQLVAIAGISYAYLSIPYSRLFGAGCRNRTRVG